MENKLARFRDSGEYLSLSPPDRDFLEELCRMWRFSSQEIRQIIRIARDLETWDEGDLAALWGEPAAPVKPGDRNEKEKRYSALTSRWNALKDNPKSYKGFTPDTIRIMPPGFREVEDGRQILGDCPVASPKTRCCNLKTLDAVIGCGFDCSYCSIQSFYSDDQVLFHRDLEEKLENLELDPKRLYHIGTGQSSDSLMWGNREGLLEKLFAFARKNPNVILELKSKSSRMEELLSLEIPDNLLLTWSLNTPVIIASEERLTSSLDERLEAARKAANRGIPVGFHLHPMVWYEGWEEDYAALTGRMTALFNPDEVVTVSFGTLTYIKPVLKLLRERPIKSKILQMPLEDAAGKWSYPFDIKLDLFRAAHKGLSPWKDHVFQYLCMEDPDLWEPVFGRSYKENEAFEQDMLSSYDRKIRKIRSLPQRQTDDPGESK